MKGPTKTTRARRAKAAAQASTAPGAIVAGADPTLTKLTSDQLVLILGAQVTFLRNHYAALAQRHAGHKVEAQAWNWDQGTEFVRGELANLEAALAQIARENGGGA